MFQHILVLLDGSRRAELALPVAVRLARANSASLTLLRLVALPADYVWYKLEPPYLAQDILTTEMRNASTYLKSKAWDMDMAGISAHIHVMPHLPLEQIHVFIEEQAIDLVVLCSRGQISSRPRWQQSMALQILRQSSVPVLVLRETSGCSGTLYPRDARPVRVLVPLDGSAMAEAALSVAATLSTTLSAPLPGMLHLMRVLPLMEKPDAIEALKRLKQHARDDAQAYLQATSRALQNRAMRQPPFSITTCVLFHPEVAKAIVDTAEAKQPGAETMDTNDQCDLIALASRGRGGTNPSSIGNTAERILQQTSLPFLVVPPLPTERAGDKADAPFSQ